MMQESHCVQYTQVCTERKSQSAKEYQISIGNIEATSDNIYGYSNIDLSFVEGIQGLLPLILCDVTMSGFIANYGWTSLQEQHHLHKVSSR